MSIKPTDKSTTTVFWYTADHRAWSANDAVSRAVLNLQTKYENKSVKLSVVGLVLTIICTVVTTIIMGSGHELIPNFFTYLILFTGLLMLGGNFDDAFSSF